MPRFYLEEMTISAGYSYEEWLGEVSEKFRNPLPRFYDFHRDFIGGLTPEESYMKWLDI